MSRKEMVMTDVDMLHQLLKGTISEAKEDKERWRTEIISIYRAVQARRENDRGVLLLPKDTDYFLALFGNSAMEELKKGSKDNA